jgi:hypothetical protein
VVPVALFVRTVPEARLVPNAHVAKQRQLDLELRSISHCLEEGYDDRELISLARYSGAGPRAPLFSAPVGARSCDFGAQELKLDKLDDWCCRRFGKGTMWTEMTR